MEKLYVVSALFVKNEEGETRPRARQAVIGAESESEACMLVITDCYKEWPCYTLYMPPVCAGPFYRAEDVDKLLEEQKPDCLPGEPAVIDTDQKIEVKMIRGDGFISPVSDCSRGYPVKVIEGKEYVYADAVRYANQSIANAVYWLQKLRAWGNSEIVQKIYKLVHPEWFNGPNTPKTANLSFSEALEAMKAGKAVRRADWPIVQFIVSLGDRFRMQRPTAGIMSLTSAVEGLDIKGLMAEDVLANDWQIVGDNA